MTPELIQQIHMRIKQLEERKLHENEIEKRILSGKILELKSIRAWIVAKSNYEEELIFEDRKGCKNNG